jgi:hypothetical protein
VSCTSIFFFAGGAQISYSDKNVKIECPNETYLDLTEASAERWNDSSQMLFVQENCVGSNGVCVSPNKIPIHLAHSELSRDFDVACVQQGENSHMKSPFVLQHYISCSLITRKELLWWATYDWFCICPDKRLQADAGHSEQLHMDTSSTQHKICTHQCDYSSTC